MSDAYDVRLSSIAGLLPVWEAFRRGGVAPCPADGGPMALAVDGTMDAYRFVCVSCGQSSPWFQAKLSQLVIRGSSHGEGASDE